MSSTLYQLSYSLFRETIEFVASEGRIQTHLIIEMTKSTRITKKNAKCHSKYRRYYLPCRLGGIRTRDPSIERAVSYHLTTNPGKKGFRSELNLLTPCIYEFRNLNLGC